MEPVEGTALGWQSRLTHTHHQHTKRGKKMGGGDTKPNQSYFTSALNGAMRCTAVVAAVAAALAVASAHFTVQVVPPAAEPEVPPTHHHHHHQQQQQQQQQQQRSCAESTDRRLVVPLHSFGLANRLRTLSCAGVHAFLCALACF